MMFNKKFFLHTHSVQNVKTSFGYLVDPEEARCDDVAAPAVAAGTGAVTGRDASPVKDHGHVEVSLHLLQLGTQVET